MLLGEFFDWTTQKTGDDPLVLVAGHIQFEWFLQDLNQIIPLDEWLEGWEVDDLLDRIQMHNLGYPKNGNYSWVASSYKNESFMGYFTYLGFWTTNRVYLGVSGYDGIEGFQSWDRDELRQSGTLAYGFSSHGVPAQTITADPMNFTQQTNRVFNPAIRVADAQKFL